jgi:LysR family transcriptional regulator, low CO2-responsive transcriptional regulator
MTSNGLRAFLELARSGSVRAAAERLSVTQPAVTAAVRSLERELGVALVARQGRGIVLTSAGETLARYAARVLGLLEETRDAVAEAADPGRGRVRVAAVTTAGEHVLPEVIRDFRAARPGVDVALEVGNRRLVWERLRDRGADLAVGGRPPAGSGFAGESVRPNDLVLVAPAATTLSREPAPPSELAGATWLLREEGSGTRATAEEFLARAGLAPATLTIGSNGAIVESVAAGLGVTLISHDAVRRAARDGDVRILPVRGLPLRRAWHVVTRAGEPLRGAPAAFVDFLRARGRESGHTGTKGTNRRRG